MKQERPAVEELLTLDEVAHLLRVSRRTVMREIDAGRPVAPSECGNCYELRSLEVQ